MNPEDFVTLPITRQMAGAIALSLGFCAASVVVFFAFPAATGKPRPRRFDSLEALRAAAILFAPVWVLLVGHVLWALWGLASEFNPSVQDGDLRWHALAFVGLITSLGALISAPLALIRVWTTERQTRTAEQGHMTDRISKAVEQLGTEKTVKVIEEGESVEKTVPNIEVRIGALLSLERIAQDSVTYDKGRDHVRVMEILCAYVRENAPASAARNDNPRDIWEAALAAAEREIRENTEGNNKPGMRAEDLAFDRTGIGPTNRKLNWCVSDWLARLQRPREDIQLAVSIIGRRDANQRLIEARWGKDAAPDAEWVFDIPCPHFPDNADEAPHDERVFENFSDALKNWKEKIGSYAGYQPDLRNSVLHNAELSNLTLCGVLLSGSHLEGANLKGARIQGANLDSARMEGAVLAQASMEGASLSSARMEKANFLLAHMQGAKFSWARMEGATFSMARMEGAEFHEARMDSATLSWARMECAVFSGTRMKGAVLHGTHLTAAQLKDLDFYKTGSLSQEQLNSSFGDGTVRLPKGLEWPAHWPRWDIPNSPLFFPDASNTYPVEYGKWRSSPSTYVPPPLPEDY